MAKISERFVDTKFDCVRELQTLLDKQLLCRNINAPSEQCDDEIRQKIPSGACYIRIMNFQKEKYVLQSSDEHIIQALIQQSQIIY